MNLIMTLVFYLGLIIVSIFSVICLAAGLFYIAELVEEYTVLTKKIIKYTIFVRSFKFSFFFQLFICFSKNEMEQLVCLIYSRFITF